MTLEADTKLVENALESMKLNGAKGVDSSRVRRNEEQTAQIENSEKFTSVESTLYCSLVMKLAYVAQDRVDIAEAVKCLTRHMKEPRRGHMQELKRLGRYLAKNKRCVLTYPRQTSDETLQVHVDSDWAGDLLGRNSTTGVIVKRGKRHMSCLQTLVALSSGEAEYHALIRRACTSLGIQSHYQDWMIDVPIQIYSDSSAARSVARRRGIGGRLRHLQTHHYLARRTQSRNTANIFPFLKNIFLSFTFSSFFFSFFQFHHFFHFLSILSFFDIFSFFFLFVFFSFVFIFPICSFFHYFSSFFFSFLPPLPPHPQLPIPRGPLLLSPFPGPSSKTSLFLSKIIS